MYEVLLSIECIARHFFANNIAHDMDSSTAIDAVFESSDVQLHWTAASSDMQDCNREFILEKIVNKYITIRGFSFSRSIMEQYKQENKKTTQKSKPLRSTLSSSSSAASCAVELEAS